MIIPVFGGDDYWAPDLPFRNRPTERPYANDNPKYINDIGHNDTNWALLTKDLSGIGQRHGGCLNKFDAEYALPIEGLKIKGNYSYYIADSFNGWT